MRKFIGVLGLVVFCFVFIGCALLSPVLTPPVTTPPEITSTVDKEGQVNRISYPIKEFVALGIIFVTSSATINSRGDVIEGSEITFDMLMREAQKLGADDIVNLRIDEIKTGDGRITIAEYKATALAIKYK
jgi:hypothetical protein